MASRGPSAVAAGTDGTDFQHRQRVASHYQDSALYKYRLKLCIYAHYLLFLVLLVKLSEDILDRLDIFILELEELYIPKPRLWEWIWSASVLFTWTGKKAIRKNNITSIKIYSAMNALFSLCPVLYALGYYFGEFLEFWQSRDVQKITEVWQGYPVALIWYAFLIVALQVHGCQLFCAYRLIKAWSIRRRPAE
jgi:hypothetical protein